MKSNMASKIFNYDFTRNNDGRRIFFWFNAASIMGVYLENEYFTWY